jgi:hypothetical protein
MDTPTETLNKEKLATSTIGERVEVRPFKMHPNLLISVMKAQAGTIAKAVLELVMNSIDASSSKIEIVLDRRTISIVDDGNGFCSRDEIEEFFETFGTPHIEGDATFGTFRMGRGQIMAFTSNVWRSGEFEMSVDLEGRGSIYTLRSGLVSHKGCRIDGTMYQLLDPSELLDIERSLREQCRYSPTPVFLNGNLLSEDPASCNWTVSNEDAFIRVTDARELAVYNLGVLVANFPAYEIGVGGVLVSKQQLALNFARNDILRGKCSVWRRIRATLTELSNAINGKQPTLRRNDDWRQFQARRMRTQVEVSIEEYFQLLDAPLFTDISGKHHSLNQLALQSRQRSIVLAPSKSHVADTMHQTRLACVLLEETFSHKFNMGFKELLSHLTTVAWNVELRRSRPPFGEAANGIMKALADFDMLARTIRSDHRVMQADKVPKDALAALQSIKNVTVLIMCAFNGYQGENFGEMKRRKYHVMESETCEAYTDGHSNIFINIKRLGGKDGPNGGISWAARMVSLLVHEYCHDFDSGTGHIHDTDFFELFHDAGTRPGFGHAIEALTLEWAKLSKTLFGKINPKIVATLDRQARVNDRLALSESDAGD